MLIHALNFTHPERLSKVTKTDLRYLRRAAKNLGHQLEIIHAPDCQMKFDKKPEILIKNQAPENVRVIIVRANYLTNTEQRTSLIKQFQLSGFVTINNHLAVARAKNKLRTMQVLASKKVPIPKTYMVSSPDYVGQVVKDIGRFPIILKTLSGSHGVGVTIVESMRGLKSIMDMIMRDSGQQLMVQEYIKESKGKDLRVFIVGKRIIGAMERIAQRRGEFRSNFHLGGRVMVASMSREEKDVAFAAVKALGLEVAGVDIIRTKNGPKILEVNANPGLEGITQATERDVAGEIIKYSVKKAARDKFKFRKVKY